MVSGVGLRYRPPGSEDGGDAGDGVSTPTAPIPTVTLPPGPIEGPDPADVGAALRLLPAEARAVERGSELVGLPAPCACEGGGWSFVVAVTGVERDVIAAYARSLSDLGDPPDVSDARRDDVTLLGVRVGEEGGPHGEVRAVVPDSGTTYAIVTVIGA